MNAGWAVSQPNLQPGAMDFEKVSSRITLPSTSTLKYDGTRASRNSKPLEFVGSVSSEDDNPGSPPLERASFLAADGYCRNQ